MHILVRPTIYKSIKKRLGSFGPTPMGLLETFPFFSFCKKSTLPPSTIAKVWFCSFNYKTGYLASPNYQNHLFYLPRQFYKRFLHFFSYIFLYFFTQLRYQIWIKIILIGIVVEKSREHNFVTFWSWTQTKLKFQTLNK